MLEALYRANNQLTTVLYHFKHLYCWYFPPPESTILNKIIMIATETSGCANAINLPEFLIIYTNDDMAAVSLHASVDLCIQASL